MTPTTSIPTPGSLLTTWPTPSRGTNAWSSWPGACRGARPLRRAEYLQLSAADLALDPNETLLLCREGFGLEVGPKTAAALDKATGSWTAATVLAAARAARTGEELAAVAQAAGPGHPAGAVAAILEDALDTLGPEASVRPGSDRPSALAGRPSGRSRERASHGEDDGLFERALKAGIPFTPKQGPWWDLAWAGARLPGRVGACAEGRHGEGGRGLPEPGRARPGVRADAGFGGPQPGGGGVGRPPPAPKRTRWTTSSFRPASTSCLPRRSTLIRRSLSWSAGVSAIRASTASVANCSTTPRK